MMTFFYNEKFDITAKADTIYLHKENRTPLNWSEYLCGKYEEIYDDLDKIFYNINIIWIMRILK